MVKIKTEGNLVKIEWRGIHPLLSSYDTWTIIFLKMKTTSDKKTT